MDRVIIESPFGTNADGSKCSPEEYERNRVYVWRCIRDSMNLGESPFASHAFYPLVLDDTDSLDRQHGMLAGFAWGEVAQRIAVYSDYGKTRGMRDGIARHIANGTDIVYRGIGVNP